MIQHALKQTHTRILSHIILLWINAIIVFVIDVNGLEGQKLSQFTLYIKALLILITFQLNLN